MLHFGDLKQKICQNTRINFGVDNFELSKDKSLN